MNLTTSRLHDLILEVLNEEKQLSIIREMDISQLSNVCYTGGSTHILATCKIGEDSYYLKFSADTGDFERPSDKSMQVGVEYLAYKIYQLYPDSKVPAGIHVVSEPSKKRIGIATQEAPGVPGSYRTAKHWANSISGGAMVDIFLANHDIGNPQNFIYNQETDEITRIDLGAAMDFRARGGRKGRRFSKRASDMERMLDPTADGAGWLLSQVDMKKACTDFLTVSWEQIQQVISEVRVEVSEELQNAGLHELVSNWDQECDEIMETLGLRHPIIVDHCEHALKEMGVQK